MWIARRFREFDHDAKPIAELCRGRIVAAEGEYCEIQSHRCRIAPSLAEVWWVARNARGNGDRCSIDYHVPRAVPDYLTLDFIWSGIGTTYRTFLCACHVLDQIARLRGSAGIVTHVTNPQLTDRLMHRLGWQQHLRHWRGRHFIKRFENGYPSPRETIF